MSSNIISRKLCFCWKRQEIGRPSGHSNRGQRRHVHIRRHAVVRRVKRETEKKREKGIVDDVVRGINWRLSPSKRLPGVQLRRVTPHGRRKVIPTYLSLVCTSGAATRAEDTAGRPNAFCFSPSPRCTCAITVFFFFGIHYFLLS